MARRPRLRTPQLQAALDGARIRPAHPLSPGEPIRRPLCAPRTHRPQRAARTLPAHATGIAVLYREAATAVASGGVGAPADGPEARAGSRGAVQGRRGDSVEPGACRRETDAAAPAQPGCAADVQA